MCRVVCLPKKTWKDSKLSHMMGLRRLMSSPGFELRPKHPGRLRHNFRGLNVEGMFWHPHIAPLKRVGDIASRKYKLLENQSFADQQAKRTINLMVARGRPCRIITRKLLIKGKTIRNSNSFSGEGEEFDFYNCYVIKCPVVNKILEDTQRNKKVCLTYRK